MKTISECGQLKMNLKGKNTYIYANSTTQRFSKEEMKTFLIGEFFSIFHALSCEYLREFSKNLKQPKWYNQGAWEKLIHVENLKSKISWHCPFNIGLCCGFKLIFPRPGIPAHITLHLVSPYQ
jgi:hypothetical protein